MMWVREGDVMKWWCNGLEIERDHPKTKALATALGYTSEQMDTLFSAAFILDLN